MIVGSADGKAEPVVPESPAVKVVRRKAAVADHMFTASLERLSEAACVDVVVAGEWDVASACHGDAD